MDTSKELIYTTLDNSDLKENFITTDSFKTVEMRLVLFCEKCGLINTEDVDFVTGNVGPTVWKLPYCRKCRCQLNAEKITIT